MSVEFSDIEWTTYDVSADSLAAAADAMSGLSEAATTEWFPRYEYEADGALTSASVTVATKVTMPRWVGWASASAGERTEWDRFCKALRAHEDGHVKLITKHLADVDARLVGKSPIAAQKAWADALSALDAASRAYDQQTDHGRRFGTIIDLDAVDAVP